MKFIYQNRSLGKSANTVRLLVTMATLFVPCMINAPVMAKTACTREDAMKAMSEASNLKTWSGVFESYKKYKQCDDGATAEGYSASVAYLLADKWKDIGKLASLSKKSADFRQFVLKHVDETMSMDQSMAIKKNIKDHCPVTAKKLCADIQHRFAEFQ